MINVAILRGGPSSEYDVSLKTGATVIRHLPQERYRPHDVFIDRDGHWHLHGVEREPQHILSRVDVVFNALHGEWGEDGQIQAFLDTHQIPYTGSKALASSLGMNKLLSKKVYRDYGIKTPHYIRVSSEDFSPALVREIYTTFPQPSVIKPASLGSSVGVSIAKTAADIVRALEQVFAISRVAIVEEFIRGREATCGVIDHFRGDRHYALMPTEIVDKTKKEIWDYESKYSNDLHEIICPGNFTSQEKRLIQEMTVAAHRALGLSHYSRSDFIVHPRRGVYILETNTLPGLTEASLLPASLEAAGATLPEFLDHVVMLALERK